ncbi:MAG TPA: prolyl oligopeptidase family serine peptidase [Candidatus Elarobacter sp.]|jgi:prolyl oligopeptidase|nr:prolyl oligopeptidase family serine peptidase [Candidatus Elarobacter sp.]
MRRLFAVLAGTVALAAAPALAANGTRLVYPEPPRGDAVDTYWSTPVPDPYRPLENADSPRTRDWLRAETAVTRTYLDALPYRDRIAAAWRAMAPVAPSESPLERHGQFWSRSGREPGKRSVLFVRDAALQPDRVLLDENALPPNVTVTYTAWSPSGALFAYATQTNGSDWLTWHLRDVLTASDLPDVLRWSKYGTAYFNGEEGLYYSGYDAPAPGHENDATPPGPYKAFYHRLGTPQSADLLLASAREPGEYPWNGVTEDGTYAITLTGPIDDNGIAVFPAATPAAPRETLIAPGPGRVRYLGNVGPRFFFHSFRGAPNGRIVEVDAGDPRHAARTIVPERADALADASFASGRLFLDYLHDVHNVLAVADTAGRDLGTIALPGLGSVTAPVSDGDDGFVYYTYQSFTEPPATFRYDVKTGRSTLAARSPVRFDPSPFVTEQLFAVSKDGTRVPVFVTHRRDLRHDGTTPTILSAYGAYGDLSTVTPSFGQQNALWLEMGGAYAVVNARGGGEYGEAWHRAGMLAQKQHGIDDVIAAAELLSARKITSPSKLALTGASAGGLMVGAVVTQRSDLFGAAVPSAALLDMLRYQKLNEAGTNALEFGSSEQSEAAFRTLYAYSPLQNVRAGTRYPAMLIMAADHDDRVPPAHSYKFAAALQHAQAGDAPILLRVAVNGGHDYGVAGSVTATVTDRYAFLAKALGFTPALP